MCIASIVLYFYHYVRKLTFNTKVYAIEGRAALRSVALASVFALSTVAKDGLVLLVTPKMRLDFNSRLI